MKVMYAEAGGALILRRGNASRLTFALAERAAPGVYARRWAEAERLAAELMAGQSGDQAANYQALAVADGCELEWMPFVMSEATPGA